jgi:5,10-methylene-tetrahydrofolate dehydrogenase/methenyl tetrahydrofolate cyclohydrolase
MTCKIIDGSEIAAQIKSELLEEVKQFYGDYGYAPGLGAIIVGKNPARTKLSFCSW